MCRENTNQATLYPLEFILCFPLNTESNKLEINTSLGEIAVHVTSLKKLESPTSPMSSLDFASSSWGLTSSPSPEQATATCWADFQNLFGVLLDVCLIIKAVVESDTSMWWQCWSELHWELTSIGKSLVNKLTLETKRLFQSRIV